ncbi:DNA mismatch repair protein MSH6-like [Zingiber officinale]|uniref:DNA mismatch repair protein MSH6-like n=1 Tax=Zingiber officinale TaxID=94328 RepID=UPI001C4C67C3|nr:DNA mismatch repair protein MSH6-like [Zingiber officinale]
MVPSRRLSGRSPLVRKQSQITTFFSPGQASKRSPNPSPNPSPSADPSPPQPKEKKPRLVISPSSSPGANTPPSAAKSGFSEDVVGRRIKVFWPLDKVWYEGRVSSFDALQGKHLVLYDDGEDEALDLSREKFEWVEEEPPRRLRRLRRLSCTVEKDCNSGNVEDGVGEEDSSGDEEWRKVGGKDSEEDDSDEVELEDEDDVVVANSSGRSRTSTGSKKRKKMDVESLDCTKKLNFGGNGGKIMNKSSPCAAEITSFCSPLTSDKRAQIQTAINNILTSEVAERFERREAEKFRFLRVGRMDAKRRCPGDENYDPKTLYLPPEFLKTLSGGQRQWWEFKSKHMDKVLFFKMGKFYELFEMDAHIGVRELDLQYMKLEAIDGDDSIHLLDFLHQVLVVQARRQILRGPGDKRLWKGREHKLTIHNLYV